MIDDLLKINSTDKKILKSVNEMKEAINICLRYLTDQELKSVEIKHMGKNIKTVGNEEGPTEDSVGTAFFVDDKGHLVTNYHVVKSSNNKAKILFNHEEVDTNMIAYDELLDLALLKAKVKNKDFIKFSNKSPQKAQSVLVAGFPYGKFVSDDLKITSGIINSLKGIKNNTSMLQIDATINPGNSGGPIVDKLSGNLVGVATMKLSKDFTKQAFGQESENTNYGIKSSQVRDFLEANNIEIKVKSGKLKIDNLESSTVFIFSKKDRIL
jgi:Trypsin-like serine proteases, typically periplasmic, contain C-terminal PDZ domain